MSSDKVCFIISPIGDPESEVRKMSDEKFDLIFKPVLEELGYKPIRADKESSSNSISRGIVTRLIKSELVIADATGFNANVFYELAIRNATKKPVIIVKEPEQKLPFDIYDKRSISINMKDNRQWISAKEELKQHIINASKDPESASESIVSEYTFELDVSKTPTKEQELVLMMKDLKDELRTLRTDVKLQNKTPTIISPEILKKANFSLDEQGLKKDGFLRVRWESGVFGHDDIMRIEIFDPKGKKTVSKEITLSIGTVGIGYSSSEYKTESGRYLLNVYINNVLVFGNTVQID